MVNFKCGGHEILLTEINESLKQFIRRVNSYINRAHSAPVSQVFILSSHLHVDIAWTCRPLCIFRKYPNHGNVPFVNQMKYI